MSSRRNVLAGLVGASTLGLIQEAGASVEANARKKPSGPSLSNQDLNQIFTAGENAALATQSLLRVKGGQPQSTKMHIAVVARDGRFLAIRSMKDAWVGSIDIAIAKARTAAFFSSDENALTSGFIGELSEPGDENGEGGAGPLWGIWASNQVGISGSAQFRNGVITFPGGVPLYKAGVLVGGVGVSGDGVDQDEAVAFAAAAAFMPPAGIGKNGYG